MQPLNLIHESYPPIATAQIKSLEERLGMKLPQSYIDFLLNYNGGLPELGGFLYRSEADYKEQSGLPPGTFRDASQWFIF